jgi:hypothetical protein
MAIFSYASFREYLSFDSFTVVPYSGSAPVINRNFHIQYANRAGRSILSQAVSVESSGVKITLNPQIRSGEEVFWIVISMEVTGDGTDAAIVYQWQARENNQMTQRDLPVDIFFTQPSHFVTNRSTLTEAELLDQTGILPGAIAFVLETNKYYRFDPEAYTDTLGRLRSYGAYAKGIGNWIEYFGTYNAFVEGLGGAESSDRVVFTVEDSLKTPPKIGNSDSTPLRYWLNNGLYSDGNSILETGKYTFEIKINGLDGYTNIFANKINYTLVGYVDRETGDLDNTIESTGVIKTWNPTNGLIILPEPLPRNFAAVYDVYLTFDNDEMLGKIPGQNIELQLDLIEVSNVQAAVSEIGMVIGDLIFPNFDKFLIVPGLKRLSGAASIATGFMIEDRNDQYITGLLPDTPGQLVTIAGNLNGFAAVRQQGDVFGYSEVLRSVVSTESGIGSLHYLGGLELSDQGISITITHPLSLNGSGIIRSDYPDSAIAGNDKGVFAVDSAYVYLESNGIVHRSSLQVVSNVPFQTFDFPSISNFSTSYPFPDPVDSSFGLFAPLATTINVTNSGDFNGTFDIYFAYAYPSPNYRVTRIDHQFNGVIPTSLRSLAEAINSSLLRSENLGDLPDKVTSRANLEVYEKSVIDSHFNDTNNPHQVTLDSLDGVSTTKAQTLATKLKTVTSNYTVLPDDHRTIITVNSIQNVTVTLSTPDPTTLASIFGKFEVVVRKVSQGNITIAVPNGITLEASGVRIEQIYQCVCFVFDSNRWIAIGNLTV